MKKFALLLALTLAAGAILWGHESQARNAEEAAVRAASKPSAPRPGQASTSAKSSPGRENLRRPRRQVLDVTSEEYIARAAASRRARPAQRTIGAWTSRQRGFAKGVSTTPGAHQYMAMLKIDGDGDVTGPSQNT